jgi:sulfonate transport system ATP-binding protein
MTGPNALVARDVRRRFGDRVVLDGIDLEIPHGQFVALLGRSGAGKTTLLRILAELDGEAEGQLHLPERRAVVFQEPRLLPWKRVLANVALGLDGPDPRARAAAALADVDLSSHLAAWPVTLSGGEAQRVALARALTREPQLLLLDEPFAALDTLTRLKMRELLARLCAKHGPAVLFITHDVEEAIALADRVLVIDGGRIVVDRPIELAAPRRPTSVQFQEVRASLLAALGVIDEVDPGRSL